jgi:hypothetical protein
MMRLTLVCWKFANSQRVILPFPFTESVRIGSSKSRSWDFLTGETRMKKFHSLKLAASVAASVWAVSGYAASFVSQSYAVSDTVSGSLINSAGFNVAPFDIQKSVHVGNVADTFLGSYGAEATGTIGATLRIYGGVSLTVPTTTALTSHGTLTAASMINGSDGRGYFNVRNSADNALLKSTFGTGDVRANLSEQIFAGAHLNARACIVTCTGGDIVTLGIGNPSPFDILRYDSPSNSVTFLGDVACEDRRVR